jgi:hypothetical protein
VYDGDGTSSSRAELSKTFYQPENIKTVNGLYVMDAREKSRLEEKQQALYGH